MYHGNWHLSTNGASTLTLALTSSAPYTLSAHDAQDKIFSQPIGFFAFAMSGLSAQEADRVGIQTIFRVWGSDLPSLNPRDVPVELGGLMSCLI
jgi:hypothetical protein